MKRKPWKTWSVLLFMLVGGMLISLHVARFSLALAATLLAALVVGLVAEVLFPPRKPTDRMLAAVVGGLSGLILTALIGAQLLAPSLLLGAALLLNMMPQRTAARLT